MLRKPTRSKNEVVAPKEGKYVCVCVCVRVCVCGGGALFIQYAMRMCRVILSSVASMAGQHFSTLYHKRYD